MKQWISVLCILMVAPMISAQEPGQLQLQIEWDIPTTREDGSPLLPGEYGGTLVRWGECSSGTMQGEVNVVGPTGAGTFDDPSLTYDTLYCFQFVGYDIDGNFASPINEQTMSIPAPIVNPSPISNVRFTWSIT